MTLTQLGPATPAAPEHRDPNLVELRALEGRIEILQSIPETYADALAAVYNDPRCGCGADDEGSMCDWDDLRTLEHVYAHRMAAAA